MNFSDPRVILVRPGEHEAGLMQLSNPKRCASFQHYDSPAYVIVGAGVEDDSLQAVSSRFGVPLHELVNFRDKQAA